MEVGWGGGNIYYSGGARIYSRGAKNIYSRGARELSGTIAMSLALSQGKDVILKESVH